MTEQVDLGALEALAKAATPGPWFASRPGKRYEEGHHVWSKREPEEPDSHDIAMHCWGQEEAEFIAAADPSTVLALIAELRQERERADVAEGELDQALAKRISVTLRDVMDARAALSRAEETIEKVLAVPNDFEWDVPPTAKRILTEYDKQKGADDDE